MTTAITSGLWTGINASPPGLTGVSSQHVRWGVPAGGAGQSGYVFTGRSVEVPLDGTTFVLGTFTHQNYPIYGYLPREFDVSLKDHVNIYGVVLERELSFTIHHN